MNEHVWGKHPTLKSDKHSLCSRCGMTRRWSIIFLRFEYYTIDEGHIGTEPGECVELEAPLNL